MTKKKKKPEVVSTEFTLPEPDEPVPGPEPIVEAPPPPTWQELVEQLPEATLNVTQRWYGEEFYPLYTELRAKLLALANE